MKDAIVQELKVISEREFTSISDLRLATVKVAAKDGEQTVLWRVLVDGWPHKLADVPEHARKYWNLRDTVTKQDGVIYKSGQVVVPSSLREIFALSAFKSSRSRVYFPANLRCGIPARYVGRHQTVVFSRRTWGGLVTNTERLQPEIQEDMWERKITLISRYNM